MKNRKTGWKFIYFSGFFFLYLIRCTVEAMPATTFPFDIFFCLTFSTRQTAYRLRWLWLMEFKLHFYIAQQFIRFYRTYILYINMQQFYFVRIHGSSSLSSSPSRLSIESHIHPHKQRMFKFYFCFIFQNRFLYLNR